MDNPCYDPMTLVAALQRIADGDDDPAEAATKTVELITGCADAPRHLTDKQLRRLGNVLAHHGVAYKKIVLALGAAFMDEIEASGLPIRHAYLRPPAWFEKRPTRMMKPEMP